MPDAKMPAEWQKEVAKVSKEQEITKAKYPAQWHATNLRAEVEKVSKANIEEEQRALVGEILTRVQMQVKLPFEVRAEDYKSKLMHHTHHAAKELESLGYCLSRPQTYGDKWEFKIE